MVLGRAESYSIERRDGDVVLVLHNVAPALRVGAVCAAVLLGTWWIGPYGPHPMSTLRTPNGFYWLWVGFFSFAALMCLLAAPFYSKNITITDTDAVEKTVFFRFTTIKRAKRARPLALWIETIVSDEGPMFPYRVHFLDKEGRVSGLFVELQRRQATDDLIAVLGAAVTLDVREGQRPDGTSK